MIWFIIALSILWFCAGILYIVNIDPNPTSPRYDSMMKHLRHNQIMSLGFFAISAALLIAVYVKG